MCTYNQWLVAMANNSVCAYLTDVEDGAESPRREDLGDNDEELYDEDEDEDHDDDGELSGEPEETEDNEGEDELREAHRYRSDSASSQDIKMLHHSLRKQSRALKIGRLDTTSECLN